VVDETIVGRWDDVDAARRLATGADAVTLEIEQIGVDALLKVARRLRRCARRGADPHYPGQDAAKDMARRCGLSCGAVSRGASEAELHEAVARAGRTRVSEDRARRIRRARAGAIGFDGPATEEWIQLPG
jgi:5-(carboxyamino)imidazole ribonucleotide synthase